MCTTCGCSDDANTTITDPNAMGALEHTHTDENGLTYTHGHDPGHSHSHSHSHAESHSHGHEPSRAEISAEAKNERAKVIAIEKDVLAKNDALARGNRVWFGEHNVLALNVLSAPGSGKTTLLERSIIALKNELSISVLEGDQETLNDAIRIKSTGAAVVQINTGAGCHLEAGMVAVALKQLKPADNSLLIIENVGNLVCPALFDLGEKLKVVLLSVTEGEDKPLKYPHMFRAADVLVINKIDLLPYLEFDIDLCINNAFQVNPNLKLFKVSATKGDGMPEWFSFIKEQLKAPVQSA